jgi:hypothetical protein
MKLLLGILLALVLIEGVAIVGLYLRSEPREQAALPLAAAPDGSASRPVAEHSADLAQRVEELTAMVTELEAKLEALPAEDARQSQGSPAVTWKDLEDERFGNRVQELALGAVSEQQELVRKTIFKQKADEIAKSLSDQWPLRYGTLDDLSRLLVESYSRERSFFLRYTPDGVMLAETDPRHAEWNAETLKHEQWARSELQALYGSPLDPVLDQKVRLTVSAYASPWGSPERIGFK